MYFCSLISECGAPTLGIPSASFPATTLSSHLTSRSERNSLNETKDLSIFTNSEFNGSRFERSSSLSPPSSKNAQSNILINQIKSSPMTVSNNSPAPYDSPAIIVDSPRRNSPFENHFNSNRLSSPFPFRDNGKIVPDHLSHRSPSHGSSVGSFSHEGGHLNRSYLSSAPHNETIHDNFSIMSTSTTPTPGVSKQTSAHG